MRQEERDRRVYELAYMFLLEFDQVNEERLEKYLNSSDVEVKNINDIFHRLLDSLQNANMKANVIGKSIDRSDGIEKLKQFLPSLHSLDQYKNSDELLDAIFMNLNPNSKMSVEEHKGNSKSLWNRYARSLFSARDLLLQFKDLEDFKKWVDFFDSDERSRAALPLILSKEIYGLGFALACDFLKEIGYLNFGKPDIHIKKIFVETGLSTTQDDYKVLKDIARVAKHVDKTAYHVDKVFWLIGSGNFYEDEISIGRQREKFIEYVNEKI